MKQFFLNPAVTLQRAEARREFRGTNSQFKSVRTTVSGGFIRLMQNNDTIKEFSWFMQDSHAVLCIYESHVCVTFKIKAPTIIT